MRARALRPLMYKVNQDYPEMKRMHDVGMCDTATFITILLLSYFQYSSW